MTQLKGKSRNSGPAPGNRDPNVRREKVKRGGGGSQTNAFPFREVENEKINLLTHRPDGLNMWIFKPINLSPWEDSIG